MHWQFHGVFQKTLYTRKVADITKLTDFTDLQTYGFLVDQSRTISAPGPTRARTRSTTQSVAAAQVCCVNSFPRAHARGEAGRRGL